MLIIYKPIFSKSKGKLVLSYAINVGLMATYYETSLYEYNLGQWKKVKLLTTAQESNFAY
jgi:hypothetical protein